VFDIKQHLYILEATGRLIPYIPIIQLATAVAIRETCERLDLSPVDIVVDENPDRAVTQLGIGGEALSPHRIDISIDPGFAWSDDSLSKGLRRIYPHEFHHCTRMKGPRGRPRTLLDAVVSEGLADHFELELSGAEPQPWSVALTDEEAKALQERAVQEYHSTSYAARVDWMMGSREKDIPKWTGYSLGFRLVGAHIERTGRTAAELVHTPAIDFIS